MSIVVVGVNHRTAPLAVLERLSVPTEEVAKAVAGLVQRDTIREAVVLSTCARTEVYLVAERFHGAHADVTEFLGALGGMPLAELHPHLLSLHEGAAATHLFEVAAGLDSHVLGESEVLGQVRSAWQLAASAGGLGSTLDLLFRHAVSVGKRARTETAIGRGTASISHAAVELAADRLGTLVGRTVVVVGAGDVGAGVVAAVRRARPEALTVVNRSPERARSLAARFGADVVGLAGLDVALAGADVVVSCAAGGDVLLTDRALERRRADHPLLIVDIGVPRNADRAVAERPEVTLLDLDDVSAWADRGRAARAVETARVGELVAAQLERFEFDVTARQAAPLVARLHERAEQIRSTELRRFDGALRQLDDEDRAAVESLTRAIVAKLLHHPSVRLRHDAGTPQGERNAAAVHDLFDLGPSH